MLADFRPPDGEPPPTRGRTDEQAREVDLEAGLAAATQDAASPALAGLSALFALFAIFEAVDLPRTAVTALVAHDVVLVLAFGVGSYALSRGPLPPAWTHRTGVIIAGLVLSNILLTTRLLHDTSYTTYVLVVVIGIGALMLSTRWAVGSLVATWVAWAAVAWPLTTTKEFVNLAFTLLGASALSIALHLARKRTHIRLLELRHVDDVRKLALERALLAAEQARDELDERVEERTRELRLADQVFASSTSAIVVTDTTRRVVRVNRAFVDITGFTPEEVFHTDPWSSVFTAGPQDAGTFAEIDESIATRGRWEGEVTARRRTGDTFPAWLSVTTVRDGEGKASHYVSIYSDITARKAAEARIEFMAHHDALTGLPNRVRLRERFVGAVAQARPDQRHVALLFLDLDRFKTINDSLGHPAGDDLLRGFGDRLSRCVRFQDTVCRQGGDEFLVLLEGVADRREVEEIARRILETASEPFTWDGRPLPTSCSIGIAVYPDDGDDFDTLLKRADIAMYQSKESGRNAYRFYGTESTTINMLEDLDLENRLRGALERRELSLLYQPVVELGSQRVVGAEALLRWTSPDRGAIPPSRFIPIAEESGLIVSIGQWVLEEACKEAKRWQREGDVPVKLAVNISGVQFMRADLAAIVGGVLARCELPASALELEITESMLVTHVERCMETIRQLRVMGVSLSVDDFGTGFSNLGYLKRFHVDTLKVDQSFVRDMVRDREGASIVRAIIELGRSLSLHTLAEGVEMQEQAEHLQAAGCHLAQGFLFSPPLPPQEFRSLLDASREHGRLSASPPARATA